MLVVLLLISYFTRAVSNVTNKEIKYNENNYYVITRDQIEFEAFVNLGGMVNNFVISEITKENFKEIFGKYL